MKIFLCMLLVAHTIVAEDTNKKINLEDIERDNLISERRSQNKEVLEGQHTQHLRPPPSVHASTNYEIRHETDEVSTNDITYAHQPQTENHQYETHQKAVQYVTVQPAQYQDEKEYESQPESPSSQYRPVHEEGRTYSAPSRHSLVSPIIPTASATPSPYLAQQPQYVYVQAGPQHSQQSNSNYAHKSQEGVRYAQGISYAQQQQSVDTTYEQVQQTEEEEQSNHGGVTYVHQTQEGAAYSPQPQQYVQYVPYVSQGPDQQTFIMMVPLRNAQAYVHSRPSSPYTQQNTYSHHTPQVSSAVTYTHSEAAEENTALHASRPSLSYSQQSTYSHHTPQVSPAVTYTHSEGAEENTALHASRPSSPYTQQSTYSHHTSQVNPAVSYSHSDAAEENSVQHAPHSTLTPAISSQLHYSVPTYSSYPHSTQPSHSVQYTPQQVQIQQSIEYPSRHEYYHAQKAVNLHSSSLPIQAPHYQSHFQPSYHYGSPQLDFFGAYNKQHSSLLDSYIPSSVILDRQRAFLQKNQVYQPSSPITSHLSAANTHSLNGYNTIAYSTPLGYSYNHLKRSPSLSVSTKLKPKATTKLSKV